MTEAQLLIEKLGTLSYIGTFGVSLLANVVVPVPEEIVVVAFGYLISAGKLSAFIIGPLIMAGLFISDTIMYLLARKGSRLLTKFYRTFFKSWLDDEEKSWISLHMTKVIFFSRFLVQLRFIGPFMAGKKKVPYGRFALYDSLAIIIYVPIYLFIGWYFHNRITFIEDGVNTMRNIVILALVIGIVIAIYRYFRNLLLAQKNKVEKK